jgi:antitoxin (DNA-binding transcriptional repressor) of toxin-antitoxin stability system
MTDIDFSEVKKRPVELIDQVHDGEEYQITRHCKVVARLGLPAQVDSEQHALHAITRLRVNREDVLLGELSSAGLISEGRR